MDKLVVSRSRQGIWTGGKECAQKEVPADELIAWATDARLGEDKDQAQKWPKRTGPAQPQGESKQVKQVECERVTEQQQPLVESRIGDLAAVQAKVIKSHDGRSGCTLDGKKKNVAGE
uniref:Uncharacterized protein n=1 Tax=Photinus pyralis TaxID=7054 RepID=A0A1Y1MVL3_PHOPY